MMYNEQESNIERRLRIIDRQQGVILAYLKGEGDSERTKELEKSIMDLRDEDIKALQEKQQNLVSMKYDLGIEDLRSEIARQGRREREMLGLCVIREEK